MADTKQIKLSSETIAYLEKAIAVARTADLDNLIVETGRVRAADEDVTIFICHDSDVPDLPFNAIGMTRLGVFSSRLDIAKSVGDATIEATVDVSNPEATFVRALQIKGKGVKVDYRCANPAMIKAPKKVADPRAYSATMTAAAVQMMVKGQSAMSADDIVLIGSMDGVSMEIKDNNSDAMTYLIDDMVTVESDGPAKSPDFFYRYPIKAITALFKQNQDGRFYITSKGILVISVDDLTVFVMPRND